MYSLIKTLEGRLGEFLTVVQTLDFVSVCITVTVSNSHIPSHVYIRLCKHTKRFLLLKCMNVCIYVCMYSIYVWTQASLRKDPLHNYIGKYKHNCRETRCFSCSPIFQLSSPAFIRVNDHYITCVSHHKLYVKDATEKHMEYNIMPIYNACATLTF